MVAGADGEGYAGSHEMGRLCSEWQSVGLLSRRVLTTLRMVISNGPFCLVLTTSTLLAPFQSLFSTPTLRQAQGRLWRKVQRLIIGTLLACGRRTVTAALRHTGQGDTPSFSLYHQVFNRARWSAPGSSPGQTLNSTLYKMRG